MPRLLTMILAFLFFRVLDPARRLLRINLGRLPTALKLLYVRLLVDRFGYPFAADDVGVPQLPPLNRHMRRALYFSLPRRLRRLYLGLLGSRALPAMAGGATIVGQRSPLFYKKAPGALPVILDASKFTGNVFYVDSAAANKSDTAGFGTTPDAPFATIDFAIGRCTASQGDVILVLPGHAETVTAAAGIDADVAGISIIGLGRGEDRPTVTFTTAAGADLDVDAADISILNILFKNDIDSQTAMIDVNSADFLLEDCELREGTAKQALIYVDLAEDRATIRRCKISAVTAGANSGIKIAAAKDGIVIEDCWIDGDFADAGIHNPTANVATNLLLRNNVVRNRQTGDHAIELVSACTGEAVGNHLFADTPGLVFDPGSLFCADNWEAHKIDSGAVPSPAGLSTADQWIHVAKATATLPATTTQNIFTVAGGRVLVKLLLGEVTTVVQAQICNLKVTSAPTTGTAVDLAANLDINADEAGTLYLVEGDGTALVGANAGAALSGVGAMGCIVPIGTIRIETSATNTGATKWDVWYLPLDAGARMASA